jgi:hypothetical protein
VPPGTTVWPNDVVLDPQEIFRESPHGLVCFLLSPFEPRELFDQVHAAVQHACRLCGQAAGIQLECRRADTLHESKTIHDDIWQHIAAADLLVVDVTALNPNVMIEYGVAAALRRPHQVILIKSEDDQSLLPFNAFAQRYLTYRRSLLGDQGFIQGLYQSMIQAVTPAPYLPTVMAGAGAPKFRVDFKDGDRPDLILGPSITHRRRVGDCLEYGSFHVFRNSWLLFTNADYRNVRVRVQFRFSSIVRKPGDGWLGVSLRNQHFHANWGFLVFLRTDGKVQRTEPKNDRGDYNDVDVGQLTDFDYETMDFVDLIAEFNDEQFVFSVGNVHGRVNLSEMPYVYGAGKARL